MELVVALLLTGIIAVTIFSQFLNPDAYDAQIARDEIIAMARAAQRKAIGHADVVMRLQPAGDDMQLSIVAASVDGPGTDTLQSAQVRVRDVMLGADVDVLDSCAITPAASPLVSSPLLIAFTYPGNLDSAGVGTPQEVTQGMRICINDDPQSSICLSAAGFAYPGDCDAVD